MKTLEEFVNQFVKLEIIEDTNCFGLYPFPMVVETKEGAIELNSLALGGDVLSCYKRVKTYKKTEASKIFMALDFPKGGDIANDFVVVYSIVNNEISIFALPYNTENGEMYERIDNSETLTKILTQFKEIID